MKRLFTVTLLGLGLAGRLAAQDTLTLAGYEKAARVILKWSPLTLINPDPTVQFGAEFRAGTRQSIAVDGGYGRFGPYSSGTNDLSDKETWRVRGEYRWYFRPYRKHWRPSHGGAFPLGTYLAVEGFYKQINVIDHGSIGRECQGGPCAFFEQTDIPVSRFVTAGHFKIGWQLPVSRRPISRFVLDMHVGIGFRHISVVRYDNTSAGNNENFFWGGSDWFDRFDTPDAPTIPDLTLGLKVGYLLHGSVKRYE